MQRDNLVRVVIDTNVWISFIISDKLTFMDDLFENIEIISVSEFIDRFQI